MSNAQRIPVLMYHRVGPAHNDWERRYSISPQGFSQHMHHLAERGMRACGLAEFFAWLAGEGDLQQGSFLLTFDDGFLGVYQHAAPVLVELGWPATVFLVSGRIGDKDEWCRDENPRGVAHPLMGIEHIGALRNMGFTFQSHTRMHPDLTSLPDERLQEELSGSRDELEDLLGQPVPYLAYPYGRHDERVVHAAHAAGYRAAFSVRPGFNRHGVDPYRIRRLDVFGTDTPAMLTRKVFFGTNDGSRRQVLRYYGERIKRRLGFRGTHKAAK